jgi:rhodanese-related sulfurtransferase
MKEVTITELKEWMASGKAFSLVDVREGYERDHFNIGGQHIPLGELMSRKDEVEGAKPCILYCEKGIRSAIAIQRLEALGFKELYNLQGGMRAFREEATTTEGLNY